MHSQLLILAFDSSTLDAFPASLVPLLSLLVTSTFTATDLSEHCPCQHMGMPAAHTNVVSCHIAAALNTTTSGTALCVQILDAQKSREELKDHASVLSVKKAGMVEGVSQSHHGLACERLYRS